MSKVTELFGGDNPVILHPSNPRFRAFKEAVGELGQPLEIDLFPEASAYWFVPAAWRIGRRLETWRRNRVSSGLVEQLHFGFYEAREENAFALYTPGSHVIAISSGLVWALHEMFFTLCCHPAFLPTLGKNPTFEAPFDSLPTGFRTSTGLLSDGMGGFRYLRHPQPPNRFRVELSLIMSQMAVEFVFYHELGHLLLRHSSLLAKSSESLIEMGATRDSCSSDSRLSHAIEFEADGFAIQAGLAQRLMFEYIDQTDMVEGQASPREISVATWGLAVCGLFRLLSQHGRSILDNDRSSTHPQPLLRGMYVPIHAMHSSAMKSTSDCERLIELCVWSSRHLADCWHKFQIPGYKHDPFIDSRLMEDYKASFFSIADRIEELRQARHGAAPHWDIVGEVIRYDEFHHTRVT